MVECGNITAEAEHLLKNTCVSTQDEIPRPCLRAGHSRLLPFIINLAVCLCSLAGDYLLGIIFPDLNWGFIDC